MELGAGFEVAAGLAARRWLAFAPRGDGHAVLVLPGLTAGDRSTQALRDFLAGRGYRASGWGLGRNFGPRPGVEAALFATLERLRDESGRAVSVVGWSLGGVYARVLAAKRPEAVRSVITLGSPISHPHATSARRLYEFTSGRRVDDSRDERVFEATPSVPTTSIYSRTDGIVAWQCSVEQEGPQSENVEVRGSHLGLGFNPAVHYAIADRLAQPEGGWRRFHRSGWRSVVYPDPARPDADDAQGFA